MAHARHMPESFDRSGNGLKAARVRVIEGLIFVFLGDHPTPDLT